MAVSRNDIFYAIGFKNISSTRHVMNNADHDSPCIHVLNNNNIVIKKNKTGIIDPLVLLKYVDHDDFYMYPYKNMMGVIVTDEITDEDDDFITLNCHLCDPYFDTELSRETLDSLFNK